MKFIVSLQWCHFTQYSLLVNCKIYCHHYISLSVFDHRYDVFRVFNSPVSGSASALKTVGRGLTWTVTAKRKQHHLQKVINKRKKKYRTSYAQVFFLSDLWHKNTHQEDISQIKPRLPLLFVVSRDYLLDLPALQCCIWVVVRSVRFLSPSEAQWRSVQVAWL